MVRNPKAIETERWEIVEGELEILSLTRANGGRCEAQLVARRLVARTPDGELSSK